MFLMTTGNARLSELITKPEESQVVLSPSSLVDSICSTNLLSNLELLRLLETQCYSKFCEWNLHDRALDHWHTAIHITEEAVLPLNDIIPVVPSILFFLRNLPSLEP